jgi:hypothetical protein
MKSASATELSNSSLNLSRKFPRSQNKSFTPQIDSVRLPGFSTDAKNYSPLNLQLIDLRSPVVIERNKRLKVSAAEYKSSPKKSRIHNSLGLGTKNFDCEEKMPVSIYTIRVKFLYGKYEYPPRKIFLLKNYCSIDNHHP